MTTVFHAWPYGRFIEIQSKFRRKKLHRTNEGSNFLGGSFSNRDNVRVPIQFRRKSQPQHLKSWFFLKNRSIHFDINSISVIRLVNRNILGISINVSGSRNLFLIKFWKFLVISFGWGWYDSKIIKNALKIF